MTLAGRICVIYNPTAARRRAATRVERLRAELGTRAEFRPTDRPGHAEELARHAALEGFAIVAAAGGDGTVHEVANGLLASGRTEVAFAVLPLGSANDYAHSLGQAGLPNWSATRQVDVGEVTADDGRRRWFVNTMGLGFSGAVALESRAIGWLQGIPLYGLAFLRALWRHHALPMMDAHFDSVVRKTPTLSLTIALGQREGNLVVAPKASLDDGWFDYVHAGPLSRWQVLRHLPKLASGGELPANHPAIWQGRCREAQLTSKAPLLVHLDGEFFCKPLDGVRNLEVRLLAGRLRVVV